MSNRWMGSIALVLASAALSTHAGSIRAVVAEDSWVENPPMRIEQDMRGYGIRAVEGRTLAEMLERCSARVANESAVQQARCDPLQHTLRNQPGNAAQ